MRNQEEIEGAIHHFGLLDKALIDVSALGWVLDIVLTLTHLEESLSDSLVDNDECMLRKHGLFVVLKCVLLKNDFVQLFEFVGDHLSSH